MKRWRPELFRRVPRAALLATALAAVMLPAHAGVDCTLSNFTVETYDHGGSYLHGTLAGQQVSWIVLDGVNSSGASDATTPAGPRRIAIALSAMAQGKSLNVYFYTINNCAAYTPYLRATGLRIIN